MFKLLETKDFLKLYPNLNCKHADGSKPSANDCLEFMYGIMNNFEINTKNRQAFFIAQCAHETQGYFKYEENLRYSYARLLAIFKNRFTLETAKEAANNPQLIANTVYANRNGNGDFDSGDGFAYRGRGLLHVTFRDNYAKLDNSDGLLSDNYYKKPELVSYFVGAVESACHFWSQNKLNDSADAGRLDINTRIINGGLNGFSDRQRELGRVFQFAK